MMVKRLHIGCSVLVLTSLFGCATPDSVKGSAAHSISLLSELNTQINAFNAAEARTEQYLLATTTLAKKEAAQNLQLLAPDSAAGKAAGRVASTEISVRLKTFLAELAAADQAYLAATQQVDTEMAKLLSPLPSTSKSLTATQSALVPLTKDLPPDVQAKEAQALIKTVQKGVKDANTMIEKARQDAAATQN